MLNKSISLNYSSCFTYIDCSSKKQSAAAIILTGIALAAIAALTVGLLTKYNVVTTGLNSTFQWIFIGAGSGVALTSMLIEVNNFCRLRRTIKDLDALTLEHLRGHFQRIAFDKNPMAAVQQLAAAIPLSKLEELIQGGFKDVPEALQSAKNTVGQARAYLAIREGFAVSIRTRLLAIFELLMTIIDSFFTAFGIGDFFKPPESKMDGEIKFQKIIMLISLFTLLTATLLPMLGVTNSVSIVGASIVSIAFLSVLWPYIRPLPPPLPEGKNLSKQAREGKLETTGGRVEVARKIAEALKGKQQYPLLIGPSGVGKTHTVQKFAEMVEAGEFPELKGKSIYYFNTTDWAAYKEMLGGGNKIVKKIDDAMGNNREKCILVLDEFHMAFRKGSDIANQLKTRLDGTDGNFPYVIALTTEEEYRSDVIQDAAIDRRFEKITIGGTDKEATVDILNRFLIKKAPYLSVKKETLEYLYEKTKESIQPFTARKILSRCIQKIEQLEQSPKHAEMEKTRTALMNAYSEGAVLGSASIDSDGERVKKITALEQTLIQLENDLKEEKKTRHQLLAIQQNLIQIREAKFRTAEQVSGYQEDHLSSKKQSQLNEFLLLKYVVEKIMEDQLIEQASSMNMKTMIDTALIDEVIAEEEKKSKEKQEAIQRAKEEADKRK